MCTAICYRSNASYFGRNLDIDRGYGESVVITPRNYEIKMRCEKPLKSHYAMIGACQEVAGEYGCVQQDEMPVEDILWSDLIVLATPIYAWYCAAPMKNVLDRHYGFNKYYGSAEGSLWAGKKVAILATHGYDGAYATDPFEMGIQRLCKHSNLEYVGLYSVQDEDNLASFQTEEAVAGAKVFARKVLV